MTAITKDLIVTVLEEHWENVCGESVPADKRVEVQNWKSYFGIRTLVRKKLGLLDALTAEQVSALRASISDLVINGKLKEKTARTGRINYKLVSLIEREKEIAEAKYA